MIIFVLAIFSFSFYDAYASGPLSFDQTSIVIDHSGIISCISCTDVGTTISVTLNGGSSGTKSITLSKIPNSSPLTYLSEFIKFTHCTTCGPLEYDVISGNTITATASGYTTTSPATIFSTGSLSSTYNVNKKTITPSTLDCSSWGGDSDGDGICNGWENNTGYPQSQCPGTGLCIRNNTTVVPYFIACNTSSHHWSNVCPSPNKADLYYEIDWMVGHKPGDDVISAVNNTFAASNYVSTNGVQGITFHAQLSEEIPHVNAIIWPGTKTSPGFDQLKYWWFGNATERGYIVPTEVPGDWTNSKRSMKAQVFHYTIFIHQQSGAANSGLSGIAEMPGNDAVISLGSFVGKVGTKDHQKASLLHEIGHNLYLDHGGNDAVGCKPNYLSVMNPSLQFNRTSIPLDFSQSALPQLNENSLSETSGVGVSTPSGLTTVYGPNNSLYRVTGQGFDWNRDGTITGTVQQDINYLSTITTCPSSFSPPQILNGFKDWDRNQMKLSPLGFGTSSMEDVPNLMDIIYTNDTDTGNLTHVVTNELSSESIIIPEPENTLMSPLDQIKSGIAPVDVKCKEGFENLLRSNGKFGGCFTLESVDIMVSRGWLTP
ncbi:MAG: hypothetical protein ACREAK_10895 [Nitrosarchaeum sp.]